MIQYTCVLLLYCLLCLTCTSVQLCMLQSGVPERARWLNTLADTLWQPILEPALSGLIQVDYIQ
jgi:hypothetical protein